jgi:hypothetical protein
MRDFSRDSPALAGEVDAQSAAGGGSLQISGVRYLVGTPTIADASHRRSSIKNGGHRPPTPSKRRISFPPRVLRSPLVYHPALW